MQNSTSQVRTVADSSTQVEQHPSSPNNAKPYVGSRFVVPPDYDDGFDDAEKWDNDGCEYCGDIHCAGSCQDDDDF